MNNHNKIYQFNNASKLNNKIYDFTFFKKKIFIQKLLRF